MQLAFVDTETLGLDHVNHPIFEVAIVLRDEETTSKGFIATTDTRHRWTFHPGRQLACADPTALRLNHFYDRYEDLPKDLVTARYWLNDVEQLVPTRAEALLEIVHLTNGRHLVGAIPSFDAERIETMLREGGMCPAWHHHLIDVEAMAVGWLAGRGRRLDKFTSDRGWDSRKLADAIGAPRLDDAHTALGDALWARDMYDAIMRGRRVLVSEAS